MKKTNSFPSNAKTRRQNSLGAISGIKRNSKSLASISKAVGLSSSNRVSSAMSMASFECREHRRSKTSSSATSLIYSTPFLRPDISVCILSQVSNIFKSTLSTGDRYKNGLLYRDAFTGFEAVTLIAFLIRTSDRNLALLLGRALDAQKLFRDVCYENRLRDTKEDVYQFTESFYNNGVGDNNNVDNDNDNDNEPVNVNPNFSAQSPSHSNSIKSKHRLKMRPKSDPTLHISEDTNHENNNVLVGRSSSSSSGATTTTATSITSTSTSTIASTKNDEITKMNTSINATSNNINNNVNVNINGVFTLLTDCYSPTCTSHNLCYSISCPRRLEQQVRSSLKPCSSLSRHSIQTASPEDNDDEDDEINNKQLWSYTVSKETLSNVTRDEQKRQEAIFELIYTERNFVKDLEYIRDFWIIPLHQSKIIPLKEKNKFIKSVFGGILDIWKTNTNLLSDLLIRQKQSSIVPQIGDIFLKYIDNNKFNQFIKYGSQQVFGKYEFERQKNLNLNFKNFIIQTENLKESKKLDIYSYLSKPTTRAARYLLLLKSINNKTNDVNPDFKILPIIITKFEALLNRINIETGNAFDRLSLLLLKQKLFFNPGDEYVDLKLDDCENRKLLFHGILRKKKNAYNYPNNMYYASNNYAPNNTNINNSEINHQGDIHVYLFDHYLLLFKIKKVNIKSSPTAIEQYKVYQSPIPLELLYFSQSEESPTNSPLSPSFPTFQNSNLTTTSTIKNGMKRASTTTSMLARSLPSRSDSISSSNSLKFPLSFLYIGRKGFEVTLYAPNSQIQKSLVEKIEAQQKVLREKNDIFTLSPLSSTSFFNSLNKINCLVPCDGGRKLIYGTDYGVFISNVKRNKNSTNNRIVSAPIKVISQPNITQLEVLEEYSILLVLSDKKLYSYPLNTVLNIQNFNRFEENIVSSASNSTTKNSSTITTASSSSSTILQVTCSNISKKGKELMSHVSFFKVGICCSKMIVCAAKNGSSNHSIKVFEANNPLGDGNKKNFSKKKFKSETIEFNFNSDPVSISILKTKLCIGCTKGFEIISLEKNKKKETLLEPSDVNLSFVLRREGLRPIAIYRVGNDFLLNYTEFSFFIDKNGRRVQRDWMIKWEGLPQSFALWFPYLIGFDNNIVEIRDVNTGKLLRAITGDNIRMLHASSQEILYAYEDDKGIEVVASMDFWGKLH